MLSFDCNPHVSFQLEARAEGRILLDKLIQVLAEIDRLESAAKTILENASGRAQTISSSVKMTANSLGIAAGDLRDFVEGLRSSSMAEPGFGGGSDIEDDPDMSMDHVRRRFEEQNGSFMNSIKSGFSSILPMPDPPLHTSIFGFDVQRGCMLSRYRGARQFWVQRPGGGMIDVLHIPANSSGVPIQGNSKAILYCNPNAGLIEVAAGLSLAGGNVASDAEGTSNNSCWSDFYTKLGFDVYLFNYAGFGRSFGAGYCGIGRRGGEEPFIQGVIGRIRRICHGTFCDFQVSREERSSPRSK